jgi:hypothetical protein
VFIRTYESGKSGDLGKGSGKGSGNAAGGGPGVGGRGSVERGTGGTGDADCENSRARSLIIARHRRP